MYINRSLENRVKYMADHFPVILVSGARQVGKTTLLKKITEGKNAIQYVTLDHPRVRQLAKDDPELFLQQYSAPVIIDEIQYAPELLPFIKIKVDENRQNGMYYLTGSQMFHMMNNVSESLAGRVGILSLFSFSRAEIESRESIPFLPSKVKNTVSDDTISDIFEKIMRGSMPQLVCDSKLLADDYYGSYIQTYIERDIRNLVNIKDEGKFTKFISCAAARTSQEVNLADIAKDVEIDRKTADSWLSILVTSGIVVLLHPYSGNTIKRKIRIQNGSSRKSCGRWSCWKTTTSSVTTITSCSRMTGSRCVRIRSRLNPFWATTSGGCEHGREHSAVYQQEEL